MAQALLKAGDFARCREAVAPLRTEPRHAAEQGSELLFGERVRIVQIDARGWAQVAVIGSYPGEQAALPYEGWVPLSMLMSLAGLPPGPWPLLQPLLTWAEVDQTVGRRARIALPRGGRFPMSERWADRFVLRLPEGTFKVPTDAVGPLRAPEPEAIVRHALEFVGAPYRWGGKTLLGVDCSGLTQVVMTLHGVALPRDSWQQAETGAEVPPAERRLADLAYFVSADAAPDARVSHVGLLVDHDRVVHAAGSGHTRVDPLSDAGIHSLTPAGPLTHRLVRVKRNL